VLTNSENGAMFPNHGMGSPFCKPNEKIQDEGCKKTRHLTKKKEQEEWGPVKQEAGDRSGDH
jgi:hypothetical protein